MQLSPEHNLLSCMAIFTTTNGWLHCKYSGSKYKMVVAYISLLSLNLLFSVAQSYLLNM